MKALETALNHTLSTALSLKLQAKQAHWNIRGSNFIMWHELLDKVASAADEIADSIAERNVQLGGVAQGLVQHIAPNQTISSHSITEHVKAVITSLSQVKTALQATIIAAETAHDHVTADLATSAQGDIDKLLWFVTAHG